jgi:hypothetical protein
MRKRGERAGATVHRLETPIVSEKRRSWIVSRAENADIPPFRAVNSSLAADQRGMSFLIRNERSGKQAGFDLC